MPTRAKRGRWADEECLVEATIPKLMVSNSLLSEADSESDASSLATGGSSPRSEEDERSKPFRLRVPRPFVYLTTLGDAQLPTKLFVQSGTATEANTQLRNPRAQKPVGLELRCSTPEEQTWLDYWEIVADVLPNVPKKRLMRAEHAFTLVLCRVQGRKRHVVGGVTFRLLIEQADGRRRLVLDVLLLAVASSGQGRGYGSAALSALKKLAIERAMASDAEEALLLTQADNLALPFWNKHGLSSGPAARDLVQGLEAWQAKDNPVYFGATPMAMRICRRLHSTHSRELLRG